MDKLGKITDKVMVRAQNQFNKIKEKEEHIADFTDKHAQCIEKIDELAADQFHQTFL